MQIIIAEGQPIIRESLKKILAKRDDIIIVSEAASARELRAKVASNPFDAVLLDISMPAMNGFSVLKELQNIAPELPVLALSMLPDYQYAVRALPPGRDSTK